MASQTRNQKLKQEMDRRGWGHKKLAELIGTDARNISRWINGAHYPQPYFREKLCEIFGKSAEELGLIKETNDALHSQDMGSSQNGATTDLDYLQNDNVIGSQELDDSVAGEDRDDAQYLRVAGSSLWRANNWPKQNYSSVDEITHQRVMVALVLALILLGGSLLAFMQGETIIRGSDSSTLSITPGDQQVPTYRDALTRVSKSHARQNAKWNDTSYCQFFDDGFHIIDLDSKGRHACMAANLAFSSLDISVDVKLNHAAFVTFYLRSQAVANSLIMGYYIRINESGKYSIQYNTRNASSRNDQDVPWTYPDSRSLKVGEGNWNTVRIKLHGSDISIWFNGNAAFVGEVPSLPFSRGTIGFGAATSAIVSDQKPPLDVVFRNLTVYDLSKQ